MMKVLHLIAVTVFGLLPVSSLCASAVDIEFVSIKKSAASWRFSVTLRHADTGWEHYANGWRVVDKDGKVLGVRVLYHPHVNEQPFTRSHQIAVPATVKELYVEARDNKQGWSKNRVKIDLSKTKGDRYEIK